ncbi:MAG: helix-turn-helix domain-containing protein [Planctomycetota bacterium]
MNKKRTLWSVTNKTVSSKQRHVDYERAACPVEATLELIGGKWKGIILYYLLERRMRYSELHETIGCVSERMLTKQLRELESAGLVERIAYAESPPRVEYELTDVGRTLEPVVSTLKQWGESFGLGLVANCEATDLRR